jgi:DNA repair exonuclease SbcCD ATPase subunit
MSSQQQPSRDREWEHWPGRKDDDDGIRHRLRALFAHTASPEESAVEELIAARGRELELRTEQLAATVADLQKREERARELRSAVEDLLRRGSSELDERHAELNALAVELSRREEALSGAEGELAERRRELGAVELRRAALERREAAVAERESALERIASELQDREARLREAQGATPLKDEGVGSDVEEASHLVWSAGDRYRMVERPGGAPAPGSVVDLESGRWRVLRVGASPLPADRRRCAFVEPLHNADVPVEP